MKQDRYRKLIFICHYKENNALKELKQLPHRKENVYFILHGFIKLMFVHIVKFTNMETTTGNHVPIRVALIYKVTYH